MPSQHLSPIAARNEGGFRLGREDLYVPTRVKMQDQRFAIDGDHGLASLRDLVSPRVLCEGLRSEPEPVSPHQVRVYPLVLADRLEKLGVRHQRLTRLKCNRLLDRLRIFESHFEFHVSEVAAGDTLC